MIPKIIHYCWLSDDPIPQKFQECIDTWSKLEGFTFIKWDKERFDINSTVYTKDAYDKQLYAFASDYIRVYALYHYGGIYLDMDIKIVKNFDDELLNRPYILSGDRADFIRATTIGCEKHNPIFKKILDYYDKEYAPFKLKVKTQPVMEITLGNALKDEQLDLLSSDFFTPKPISATEYEITPNTYCIHLYASSWTHKFIELMSHRPIIRNKRRERK